MLTKTIFQIRLYPVMCITKMQNLQATSVASQDSVIRPTAIIGALITNSMLEAAIFASKKFADVLRFLFARTTMSSKEFSVMEKRKTVSRTKASINGRAELDLLNSEKNVNCVVFPHPNFASNSLK